MAQRANSMYLVGIKAGADLSSSQYKAVKYDSAGDVVVAGAGEAAAGILMNAPASGAAADVVALGGALAIAGATSWDEGVFLKVDGNGDLIPVTTDKDFYIARAIRSAVDNDISEVFVHPGYYAV